MNNNFMANADELRLTLPLFRKVELELSVIFGKQANGARGFQLSPAIIWTSAPRRRFGPFFGAATCTTEFEPRRFTAGFFLLVWDFILSLNLTLKAPWARTWIDRYNKMVEEATRLNP